MDDHLIDDIIFNIHQQILDEEEARRRPINGDLSDEEFWEEDELYKDLLDDDKDWADDEDEFGKDNIQEEGSIIRIYNKVQNNSKKNWACITAGPILILTNESNGKRKTTKSLTITKTKSNMKKLLMQR